MDLGTGTSRTPLFIGYLVGAGIMLIGGLVEVFLGVNAAGKSLEQVTKPLTSVADNAAPATSAEPAAGHAGSKDVGTGRREFDQQIQFLATHFVVVAQAVVGLIHQLAKLDSVQGLKCPCGRQDPLILGDYMTTTTIDRRRKHALMGFEI